MDEHRDAKTNQPEGGLMNEQEFKRFCDVALKKIMNESGDIVTACKVLMMLEAQLMDRR